MKSPYSGVKRVFKAFGYSYNGFISAFKSEAAFRQDLLFCLIAGGALFFIPATAVELAMMAFSLMLILIMELTNTAIEAVVDRIGAEYHDLSKKAKDIGSLLVLLSFINAFTVWGIILAR